MSAKKYNQTIKWNFDEHPRHQRGRGWYLAMIIVAIAMIVYSLFTHNWLFALIIIMIGIMVITNHYQPDKKIEIEISRDGVKLGEKIYKYDQLDKFWIIYQPPYFKNLYFSFKSTLRPDLSIPLEGQNPVHLKAFVRQYLTEDLEQEQPSFSETLGRILKI